MSSVLCSFYDISCSWPQQALIWAPDPAVCHPACSLRQLDRLHLACTLQQHTSQLGFRSCNCKDLPIVVKCHRRMPPAHLTLKTDSPTLNPRSCNSASFDEVVWWRRCSPACCLRWLDRLHQSPFSSMAGLTKVQLYRFPIVVNCHRCMPPAQLTLKTDSPNLNPTCCTSH